MTSTAAAPGTTVWTNWARTQQAVPARVVRPRDAGEVAEVVRAAVRDGLAVKAVGAGHSFTGAAVTDGVHVATDALTGVRSADAVTGLVEVAAGTRLHHLSPVLWQHGLALPSLGDIDRQAVAGAVATGTHGTGLAWGGIAGAVRALELVTADGGLVRCSADERPDLFHAARVGLGAFGVVTSLTLQCVPAFGLAAQEEPVPLEQFLEQADELMTANDHLECFWFPHTGRVLQLTKQHLPPGTALEPQPRWRQVFDEKVMATGGLATICRVGAAAPARIPALNRLTARLMSSRSWSDRSYRVFANERRIRFREMEYGVPLEAWKDVFAELRRVLHRPGLEMNFPVELRFTGPDDAWLGMGHGRRTAYVAVQPYHRTPHTPILDAAEAVFGAFGGRPHWGKLHGLDADRLAGLYPRFADAVRVRDEVDPGRVFGNAYLRQVLGG